tara:strand:- start:1299 stop:1805 length:507 start_codon:yes stop_codon:yes gene_type:complete
MFIKTKINNYKEVNKNLLSLINKMPKRKLKTRYKNMSNSDWDIPRDFKRDYLDYFYKIIEPYMGELAKGFNSKKWTINNCWFQQYKKLDNHEWHTHPQTNFTNVYFVELPSKSIGTEVLNTKNLNLKEGDLLTFPGYFYHRSPVNFTNKRKTIISFNSDFYDYNKGDK